MENNKISLQRKTIEVQEFKTFSEIDATTGKEKFYIEGYANTKNKPDSYGDVPTNFLGKPVYDLSRFSKNPVMFADHEMSISNILGYFVDAREDEKGLFIKALLKNIEDCFVPSVKEAITNFKLGFARALSIQGRWFFDDPKNPTHLTRAYIHEISGVGVGSDEDSLINNLRPKSIEISNEQQLEKSKAEQLEINKKTVLTNLQKKGVLK